MNRLTLEEGAPLRKGMLSDGDTVLLGRMAEASSGMLRMSADGSLSSGSCIAHVMFADGTTLDIVPEGHRREYPAVMLHEIFGLDYRRGEGEDLFEFLVMLFIRDVKDLLRKGLKSAYSLIQSNETSFKGRLLFAENIRENLVHKERVFVEYELFSADRAENRLIRSTLEVLLKKSTSPRCRRDIKTLLTELEEIPPSPDISRDLDRVCLDRNMLDYISVMTWCEVFLKAFGIAGSAQGGASFAVVCDSGAVEEAYVARVSSHGRADGSFSAGCTVSMAQAGSGCAVVVAKPEWFYYDRSKKTVVSDAESLYRTAPGYTVMPERTGGRSLISSIARRCLDGSVSKEAHA